MLPACKLPEPCEAGPAWPPAAAATGPRPLRVLLVAHCLVEEPRAGTETYVANLGQALGSLGVDVRFLAPGGPPSEGSPRNRSLAGNPAP
jgi:hypothetical protein